MKTVKFVTLRSRAAACIILLAAATGCAPDSGQAVALPEQNSEPPHAKGPTTGGGDNTDAAFTIVDLPKLDTLLKAQRGKTVVVNFWATWCPPCVAEMPEFAEFYREHETNDDVVLLSVTADHPETLDSAVKPFVTKYDIPFPIYVMSFMPSEELTSVIGYEWVDGNLPATFVYKPDGTLQNVWFVQIKKADLDKAVAKAMDAA